jgi:hypothetical protein
MSSIVKEVCYQDIAVITEDRPYKR